MNEIKLILLHFSDKSLLTYLQKRIASLLDVSVSLSHVVVDIKNFYHTERAQYDAAKILQEIDRRKLPETAVVCTDIDLFIPIFTHVFGLAKLNGSAAIVSSHRLENRFYGLKDDPDRLGQRLLKEIIHEVGHLGGLRHCPQASCVMASSETADELDIKNNFYCVSCLKQKSYSNANMI